MSYLVNYENNIGRFEQISSTTFKMLVRVPSSEYVAQIVGRKGCKIKELRIRTSTKIVSPKRDEEPVFIIVGHKSNVLHAKELIESAVRYWTRREAKTLAPTLIPLSVGATGHDPISATIAVDNILRCGWSNITYDHVVQLSDVATVVGREGSTIRTIQNLTITTIISPQQLPNIPIFKIMGNPVNVKFACLLIDALIATLNTNGSRISVNELFEAVIAVQKQNQFADIVYFIFYIISSRSSNNVGYSLLHYISYKIAKIFEGNHVNPIQPTQLTFGDFLAPFPIAAPNNAVSNNLEIDVLDSILGNYVPNNINSTPNNINWHNSVANNFYSNYTNSNDYSNSNGYNYENYHLNSLRNDKKTNNSKILYSNNPNSNSSNSNGSNSSGYNSSGSNSNVYNSNGCHLFSNFKVSMDNESMANHPRKPSEQPNSNTQQPPMLESSNEISGLNPSVWMNELNNETLKNNYIDEPLLNTHSMGYGNNIVTLAEETCIVCHLKGRLMFNEKVCWGCESKMTK